MVNLHVMHSWGGGLERWVQNYCQKDGNTNLVLKSIGEYGIPAKQICLYEHIDSSMPIRSWQLDRPILATDTVHLEYRYIIEEITRSFCINNIIISSFIGHSLELLRTNVNTLIVCHDFYPFCPMIFAYFEGNCQECNFSNLKKCFAENPNNLFPFASSIEWMSVRKSLLHSLVKRQIPLIIPSPFMKDRLIHLDNQFHKVPIHLITHGMDTLNISGKSNEKRTCENNAQKFNILILGQLTDHKGGDLFSKIYHEISEVADIYLLGCGDSGCKYNSEKNINVIPKYNREDLPSIINRLNIDLALLMSVCTETFSYALSELMCMKIPTLATNIGSFADRIEDEVSGFLVNPDPHTLTRKIKFLIQHPTHLLRVKNNLSAFSHKTVEEMLAEYYQFLNCRTLGAEERATEDTPNVSKSYIDITSYYEGSEFIEILQSEIITRLDYKRSSSERKVPDTSSAMMLSKRFGIFRYLKNKFPKTWECLRKLFLRFAM